MARITVNTDQVSSIAAEIEGLNKQLTQELERSKKLFDTLGNSWSGEAYEKSRASYNEFASKYFQNYEKVIADYVTFLRNNVSQGYFDVESANENLGEAFK